MWALLFVGSSSRLSLVALLGVKASLLQGLVSLAALVSEVR